ncbi:MAG: ABC transporter permease [Bacteroidota bacterium]
MNLFIPNLRNTFRQQKRQKGLSLINILGIMLGYGCFFMILSYTWHEKSYDRFHPQADNIYRLAYNRYDHGRLLWETANSFYPTGRYLKENSPEVVNCTSVVRNYNITITTENAAGQVVAFNEEKTYYVSSSFFSMFSFPLLKGKAIELDKPNTAFITPQAAKKYFGDHDPVGKLIKINGVTPYTIAGVLKDLPSNTHLKFSFLFSLPTHLHQVGDWVLDHWFGYDLFYTYIQLRPGADPSKVERMLPVMVEKNYGKQLSSAGQQDRFYIQPLKDIHLFSNIEYETEKPGNGDAIHILMYFSVFVLLITWINHINLVSAQSVERAKEVGIRKAMGGSRRSIIWQIATENVTVTMVSLAVAAFVVWFIYFILPKPSSIFPVHIYGDFRFWLVVLAVITVGTLLTSLIPALSISMFNPVNILKGKLVPTFQGVFLRKALLSFQFIVSFVLLTGAILVHNQGVFLMEKDRGLDNSSVVAIRFPKVLKPTDRTNDLAYAFQEEVKRLPWVKDFTIATDMPEREIETFGGLYRPQIGKQDEKFYFRIGADDHFFSFFKMKLLAGRFFSKTMMTDQSAIILNESAVKKLGFENPSQVIGKKVKEGDADRTIIGVVKDFHYKSVKVKPVATMFNYQQEGLSYFAIKLYDNQANAHYEDQLNDLSTLYSRLFPSNPFEYFFLEDAMKQDLQADLDFARLFGIFSGLSILISLIGLLGLVIVHLNQRVKELGIRKVLGARLKDISILVIKMFLAPLSFALLIGIPLSVWGFSTWISHYYLDHIPFRWYYFFLPAILLPLVAILVILFQVIQVNNRTTIQSLRNE